MKKIIKNEKTRLGVIYYIKDELFIEGVFIKNFKLLNQKVGQVKPDCLD